MSTSIEREYDLAIAITLGALGKFYIAYGKYKISSAKAYCIKKASTVKGRC